MRCLRVRSSVRKGGVAGLELRALNLAVAASVKKLCPYTLYKHRHLMCQETG